MAVLLLLSLLTGLAAVFIFRRFRGSSWLNEPAGLIVVWLARFCYFMGFPYLALIAGGLSSRSLGLLGLENFLGLSAPDLPGALPEAFGFMLLAWGADVGRAILLALGAALALLLLRWLYQHQWRSLGAAPVYAGLRISAGQALYDIIHLAFYRALIWGWGLPLPESSVLSLLLFLAESWAFSRLGSAQFSAEDLDGLAERWLLAVCGAAFFIYVPNIWLAVLTGFLWLAIINRFPYGRLGSTTQSDSAAG